MSTAKGLGTFSPEGDHTLTRTSPLAELAPDAPIVITRAMLTAAFRTRYTVPFDALLAKAPHYHAELAAAADHAAKLDADELLADLHTVAQQVAAAQGATA